MNKVLSVKEQISANPELIPSLPNVVTEALALLDKPDVAPDEFEGLLKQDPPLVATMLKIANSPIYGFRHERESIRDAIVGIGLNGLRSILMSSSLKRFHGKQFACYGKDPKALWRHSMAVANAAKLMTKRLPNSPDVPEEMFIAGLLHDLGKLLLAPFLTKMGHDLSETKQPLHLAEEQLLGISHMEAGGMVAKRWNLKPMAQAVISHHHFKSCPPAHRHAVAVVRLADQWATDNDFAAGAIEPPSKHLSADLEVVGITADQWEKIQPLLTESANVDL